MIARVICALYLAVVCHAAADDVVGWKIPFAAHASWGLEDGDLVKMKKAPERSSFFKAGDQLYDLSRAEHSAFDAKTQWLVWNATSGMLVTKAGWDAIGRLHRTIAGQSMQCRVKLEVLEAAADGAPPSSGSKFFSSISVVCRDGQEFEVSKEAGGKSIRLKGTAMWVGPDSSSVDLKMEASYTPVGQPELFLATMVCLESGSPMWIARDFSGGKGLDLRVSAGIESLDGVPMEKLLVIQKGDRLAPVACNLGRLNLRVSDDSLKIGDGWLTSDFLVSGQWPELDEAGSADSSVNPFSDGSPFPVQIYRKSLAELKPPEVLKPWIDHPVLDIRPMAGDAGLHLESERDFLGYDPIEKRTILYSADEQVRNRYTGLFSLGLRGAPPVNLALITDGPRPTRIVSRSGVPATLRRKDASGKVLSDWRSELVVEEDRHSIQLELGYGNTAEARATLEVGRMSEILPEASNKGNAAPLRVKVEIQRP